MAQFRLSPFLRPFSSEEGRATALILSLAPLLYTVRLCRREFVCELPDGIAFSTTLVQYLLTAAPGRTRPDVQTEHSVDRSARRSRAAERCCAHSQRRRTGCRGCPWLEATGGWLHS